MTAYVVHALDLDRQGDLDQDQRIGCVLERAFIAEQKERVFGCMKMSLSPGSCVGSAKKKTITKQNAQTQKQYESGTCSRLPVNKTQTHRSLISCPPTATNQS